MSARKRLDLRKTDNAGNAAAGRVGLFFDENGVLNTIDENGVSASAAPPTFATLLGNVTLVDGNAGDTVEAAVAAASANDVLVVAGDVTDANYFVIDKELTFIGLPNSSWTSATPLDATADVTFKSMNMVGVLFGLDAVTMTYIDTTSVSVGTPLLYAVTGGGFVCHNSTIQATNGAVIQVNSGVQVDFDVKDSYLIGNNVSVNVATLRFETGSSATHTGTFRNTKVVQNNASGAAANFKVPQTGGLTFTHVDFFGQVLATATYSDAKFYHCSFDEALTNLTFTTGNNSNIVAGVSA